ncbi:hypothetical protein LINPERPRIM_LOCUS18631 [Linum perenne]
MGCSGPTNLFSHLRVAFLGSCNASVWLPPTSARRCAINYTRTPQNKLASE